MYEKEVKRYCRRAGNLLTCDQVQRNIFNRIIRESVQNCTQETPSMTWPEIEGLLGSPEDAARQFIDNLPPGTAEKWAHARKIRHRVILFAVCLTILLLVGCIVALWASNGLFIIETETTIVYQQPGDPIPTPVPLE